MCKPMDTWYLNNSCTCKYTFLYLNKLVLLKQLAQKPLRFFRSYLLLLELLELLPMLDKQLLMNLLLALLRLEH